MRTALMFAAMFDRIEIINLMLLRGVDSSVQSSDGTMAIGFA